MTLPQGTLIGRYIIHSKIGSGGMGEIYLAEDTRLHRKIALKLLPIALTNHKDRLRRFEQEARAASALNHPNILTIHEIGIESGVHFIGTEFVEGVTLREHMRQRMPLEESLNIAIQVASALSAAHAAGIVHRDIKPENLMIRADGYVKVLDFGLAKLTENERGEEGSDPEASARPATNTAPGVVMGTSSYMSPEQARGLLIDARTDIWSLGVVIYEMVARRLPFEGGTPTDVIARVIEREPAQLTRFAPDLPSELQRIVTKALSKNREERYQGVKDMLLDLKALKQELDFETKLGFSDPLSTINAVLPAPIASGSIDRGPVSHSAPSLVWPSGAVTDSSAPHAVGRINRAKVVALIVLFIVLSSAVGIWLYLRARSSGSPIDSIAVLPFVNQNNDPNTEYLSDGLTESIINSLTQLPDLRVIARSSVFRYKGRETDPMTVGREMDVRAILTGRVLQRGDNLSISVELMDVQDNKQLWSEKYDRNVSDLLTVQRDIAQEISGKLRIKLSGADQSRLTKRYTENAEAYRLYLKGRFYWNKRTGEALKKAVEHFNQAIEKDPSYALAYSGLADAYVLLSNYSASIPHEAFPRAKAAAKKALEMDDSLAEAHASLANALFDYDWNFPESNTEFQRAIALNPNYATAHQWYANRNLLRMGRFEEAIAELKRAQELDPLSLIINDDLGTAYVYARQPEKAIEQLRKTIEMDQAFYLAHWDLGMAYELKGSFQEALAEYRKARQLDDDPYVLAQLGHALAAAGKRDEALKTLDELHRLAKQRYVPSYGFALVYAGLGDRDRAFEWLERSYQDRSFDMTFLRIDPFLDNLRSDPRFAILVRKVGL